MPNLEFVVSGYVLRVALVNSELKLPWVTLLHGDLKTFINGTQITWFPMTNPKKLLIVLLLPIENGRFNDHISQKCANFKSKKHSSKREIMWQQIVARVKAGLLIGERKGGKKSLVLSVHLIQYFYSIFVYLRACVLTSAAHQSQNWWTESKFQQYSLKMSYVFSIQAILVLFILCSLNSV